MDALLLGSYFCDLIFNGLPATPRLGADLFGAEFDVVPGASYRTAAALGRLGVHAAWLCDFGDDLFSRFVLEQAERDGLDTRLFRRHPFPLRRVSVAFSFADDRGFISYADPLPRPSPREAIERYRPRAVLISNLAHDEWQAEVVAAARAAGSLVYMDCQDKAASLEAEAVRQAISRVDVFAPNQAEALRLTGAATGEAALGTLASLAPMVVIKCGAAGAMAQAGGQVVRSPALAVDVCDTTGAGDCFNAGFLYGLLAGHPLETCLRCGNICGGLATTTRYKSGLPTGEEMEARLREKP